MNLLKRKKLAVGLSAGLVGVTSIVAPISICVSCGPNIKYIDSIDEQFDISSATYKSMKKQLKVNYENSLKEKWLPEEEIKEEMQFLQKDLDSLDQVAQQSEKAKSQMAHSASASSSNPYILEDNQLMDYTSLTNALIEIAEQRYGVHLTRESSATWSDLRTSYQGLRDSTENYMSSLGMRWEEIQQELVECDLKRDAMMKELMAQYGSDALSGLINGLPKLISCFESVNLDVAALAATNALKEFFSKFSLVFNPEGEKNRYDQIESELIVGKPIDEDVMRRMFICVEQRSGSEIPYKPDEMLPGYKLVPVLHEKMPDPIHNTYKISIDWSITNKTYVGTDDEDEATGHVYGQNQDIVDGKYDETTKIADVMRGCEREYLEYTLYPTAAYEAKQIAAAYFNPKSKDGYIRLKWHDFINDNKYEQFFSGITTPTGTTGKLTLKNLADSGLQISENGQYYTDVSEILNTVGEDKFVADEDALTLSEKFVRYCDITSDVTIVDGDKHLVTNKFSIEYRNSYNKHDDAHWNRDLPLFHNDNYPISPEFFVIANDTFNHAKQWVDVYRNRKIDEMYDHADNLIVSLTCTSVKTALYTAYYVFRLVVPLTVAIDGVPRPCWAAAIALATCHAVLLATYITLVTKYMIKPLKECASNNEKFLKSASFRDITKRIDDDQKYFCLYDENGKYNKKLYDDKMYDFCQLNFQTEARPLYQFYATFHNQEVTSAFVQGIIDNHIDSVTIQSITDKFTLPTGLIDVFGASYTVSTLILNLALGPTTNPFKPWKWGTETWLWAVCFLLEQALSGAISGVLYIVTHTIKKFCTGIW